MQHVAGNIEGEYEYTFKTTDPDGDAVYYEIEWGDGTNITDLGPYESGEGVILNHTWYNKGTYTIEARVRDIFGTLGDWGTLEVTMPKNQQTQNVWLLRWLERLPRLSRLLDVLMGNLGFWRLG